MPHIPDEIWFVQRGAQNIISDYLPCPMKAALNDIQCETVKTFFRELLVFRQMTKIKVSKFMWTYRKERNNGLFMKRQNLPNI